MSSINFIPENTLKVLYGNNVDFPFDPNEVDFDDWCGNLLSPFRRDWANLPVVTYPSGSSTSSDEPELYKFSYHQSRFNPFHLSKNFSTALHLLDECYALKDSYKQFEVLIMDQDAKFKMSEELRKIEADEIPILKNKLYSIANAQSIVASNVDDELKYHGNHNDVLRGDSDELELEINKRKREVLLKEEERLKSASKDPKSPYNKNIVCSRLKAKYTHRFTELVMLIDVIKHGLFILKGIKPYTLPVKTTTLHRAIDDFRRFPDAIYDLPLALQKKEVGTIPSSEEETEENILLEPESDIRMYLWKISKILQQDKITSDNYIQRVSVKHLVDETEGRVWNDDLNAKNIGFELNHSTLSSSRLRLLGISAEVVLKDSKKLSSHGYYAKSAKGTLFEVIHSNEKLKNSIFNFNINVPNQYLGDSDKYPTTSLNNVEFMSSPSLKNQTSALNINGSPTFYGRNIIENYSPQGFWQIMFNVEPNIDNLADVMEDIYLYLHVKK